MSLNKNKDKNYVGFEDVIANQEHSQNFKKLVNQVKLRKSINKRDRKAKTLENTSLFNYSKLYEKNNGSGYSVMEEVLTNFNISKQAKDLTDLVTYVATKEFDDVNLEKFNKFLKECAKCIKYIQEQEINASSKSKKLKAKSADFSNVYPEDVYNIASTANNLMGNVAANADNIIKLYKGKNRIIFTPENYLVYNLATVDDKKLKDEVSIQNSVVIPRIQQAYRAMYKQQLQLERIPTLNDKVNNYHLNNALLIDSKFNVNNLPDVFMTIQSQTANARTNFLTDMNRNRYAVMKNIDLPLTIVRFPEKELDKESNTYVPVNYSKQKTAIVNNLLTKYPETELYFAEYKEDKYYTGYSYENGKTIVKVKNAATFENESSAPKDIVNAIFQVERANNEVSVEDINKTLLLSKKLRVKNEIVKEKARLGAYKGAIAVKEKDLLIKNKEVLRFFQKHGINNYEVLMQRAIALGATMNTLKLSDCLDPQAVKACNLFLESEFNKTITLLSSLDKDWVMPYITEKITRSFELEVEKLNLAKQDVLDRFEKNGMAVNADTTCTLRQIAFAKPKYQDALKLVKDADELSGLLDSILNKKKVDNTAIEAILDNNTNFDNAKAEVEAESEEEVVEEKEEKPLELKDVTLMVKKVFEQAQSKVEKKIFDKSESVTNQDIKAKYNSAYVLSSTILDLYDDVLNLDEMLKNEAKKEDLNNKENLTEDEKVLKVALEYNEGYYTITNLIARTVFDNTQKVAERTGRTDKVKIARSLAKSLSKTIEVMFSRDYEKECNISILRKDAKNDAFEAVLKEKVEQIIKDSEKE